MNTILVCAATEMELLTCPTITFPSETLITGAGSASTAFHLARFFSRQLPDLAIQIGIAGAFHEDLVLGKVVQVKKDCFADLGAQDKDGKFLPLSELIGEKKSYFSSAWLSPPDRYIINGIPEKIAITVNMAHGRFYEIEEAKRTWQADIETMEGAAFFASCMSFGIPCLQLRAISNLVEPRNREAWDIQTALLQLKKALDQFFRKL